MHNPTLAKEIDKKIVTEFKEIYTDKFEFNVDGPIPSWAVLAAWQEMPKRVIQDVEWGGKKFTLQFASTKLAIMKHQATEGKDIQYLLRLEASPATINWAIDTMYAKFKDLEGDAQAQEFGGYRDWILPGAAVGTVAAAGAGAWWAKGRREREGPFLKRAEHRLGLI